MKRYLAASIVTLTAFLVTHAGAGEPLRSGPQVGKSPTPFDPLHVTGANAGEKECLV